MRAKHLFAHLLLITSWLFIYFNTAYGQAVTQPQPQSQSQQLNPVEPEKIVFNTLELDLDNAKLSLTQVQQNIQNAKDNLREYQEELQELNFTPQDPLYNIKRTTLQARIANQQDLVKLNEQRRSTLENSIAILTQKLLTAQETYHYTRTLIQKQRRLAQEKYLKSQIQILSKEQQQWLNKIDLLNQQLLHVDSKNDQRNYQRILQKIFSAEEQSNITQLATNMLYTQNNLNNIISNIIDDDSASNLNEERHALLDIVEQLEQYRVFVKNKLHLLQQKKAILNDNPKNIKDLNAQQFGKILNNLSDNYQAKLDDLNAMLTQADNIQDKTTSLLAKALARRQGLPGLNTQGWTLLTKGLTQLMVVSYQVAVSSAHDFYNNIIDFNAEKKARLLGAVILLTAFFVSMRYFCQYFMQRLQQSHSDILKRFLFSMLRLIKMHLWYICLIAIMLYTIYITELSDQAFSIVLQLGNAILLYSIAINAARIVLYENLADQGGNDVQLFWRLCWVFSLGLIIGSLTILSQELSVLYVVQDFFNRLFALFVLITALMLLKAWRVVPTLITPSINPKREYLIRTINLLGFLIPLIILSNAVTALIGYVELAWTISKYEGIFLLVVTCYLVLKGALNDIMDYLAHTVIRMRSGWIFSEAILKPTSAWLHVMLFLGAIYSLLLLYGLNNQPIFIDYFYKVLHFPIIRLSNSSITVWVLIKAFVASLIFIWATRWSREFFYRRIYTNVRDIGTRNSLSIFSQYGVATLGIIIILKTLQVDFTTISIALGGLALGAGFGLRDLANNFASGLMLLIERPVRRGDTVTIGNYEGKVIDIGMRAITILSSDNREIVVPNSEAFTKTFINWTKQNDVVRCEIMINIRWEDDPHILSKEIAQIMLNTQDVLPHPAPDVMLKSITDGLLEFELRFYIHYNLYESRTIMKSKVLFNIWNRLHELGISPAHPTQNIFLRNDSEPTN